MEIKDNSAACVQKIIIADDHAIFRQGLIKLLNTSGNIAINGECCNGEDALQLIRESRPDIAILDISMPLLNGIEVTMAVRNELPDTKVILLTMHNEPAVAKRSLRAGASGYVLKDSAFDELLDAINCVVSGEIFVSPSLKPEDIIMADENIPVLTGREAEVLQLITDGCTNRDIAKKLGISLKTVDSHRTNVMHKCGTHTTADLVRYAIKAAMVK